MMRCDFAHLQLVTDSSVQNCPSLAIFNTRQYLTTASWDDDYGATLWVCVYYVALLVVASMVVVVATVFLLWYYELELK